MLRDAHLVRVVNVRSDRWKHAHVICIGVSCQSLAFRVLELCAFMQIPTPSSCICVAADHQIAPKVNIARNFRMTLDYSTIFLLCFVAVRRRNASVCVFLLFFCACCSQSCFSSRAAAVLAVVQGVMITTVSETFLAHPVHLFW